MNVKDRHATDDRRQTADRPRYRETCRYMHRLHYPSTVRRCCHRRAASGCRSPQWQKRGEAVRWSWRRRRRRYRTPARPRPRAAEWRPTSLPPPCNTAAHHSRLTADTARQTSTHVKVLMCKKYD